MKTFIADKYKRVKDFYARYERLFMSGTLVGGFLFDFIAFVNIDIVFKFTILIIYWLSAGVAIAFMQLYDLPAGALAKEGGVKISRRLEYTRLFMPLVVQWTFGGLLNISLIFYWFSGAFSVSWPLLIIMVLLLLFNDSFRHYFSKPLVQITVYSFITLSLFSLVLPFLFASLSPWLFVIASVATVIIFLAYIYGISHVIKRSRWESHPLFISVIVVVIIMNVLYFTNVIPPIPLAMREAGLYHSLTVSSGKYSMQGEPETFWQHVHEVIFGQTIHVMGDPASAQGSGVAKKIYLYTAIFAPDNLDTTIVHRWQYYDESQKEWVNEGDLSFVINGGRQEGYKSYSWQSNLAPGKWRVYVQNQRGQVLARIRFTIERVAEPVVLEKVVK